MRLDHIAVQFS